MIDPPPSLRAIRAIEERALRAWPALETMPCQGWQVRYAQGYTRRANSANAIAPSSSFSTVRPLVEIFYRSRRLPVTFRLSPLAGGEVDLVLDQAGYHLVDQTMVMLANLPFDAPSDPGVVIEPVPSRLWDDGVSAALALSAHQHLAHRRIVDAIPPPRAFATLMDVDEPAGFGLAVAERGMIGLFDIIVARGARRRGIGRRIAQALLAWGRGQGAQGAYLQVAATNSAAIALYLDLGFEEAYRYHYRVQP